MDHIGIDVHKRIVNINALRQRWPPSRPPPSDIIAHTQTPAAPGAAATAHISGLLAGRASRPG